jgi:SAM-dependent methyltransferase
MTRLALVLLALFTVLGSRPGLAQVASPGIKVLAETRGKQGLVRVEERDGLRLLTINGVVQGGRRLAGQPGELEGDAAAALARAACPKGRRALVVGLGTGQTVAELVAGGFAVDAVEIEPAVVSYARQYFGYQGPAEALDGRAALARNRRYDLVLIDAAIDKQLPAELVDAQALDRIRAIWANPAGVAIFRMVARPTTAPVTSILHPHPGGDGFYFLFGSGVGDEEQNLYLLWSRQQFQVLAPPGLSLQLLAAGSRGQETFNARELREGASDGGRRVLLLGYLIRTKESGQLALDLPHYEMGAMRFRLLGPAAAALAARAPKPSEIVVPEDEDDPEARLRRTLNELLGGGGVRRNEVRFSPVVAAVEGTLRFRAAVDPDRAAWPFRERDLETGRRLEVMLPLDEPLLPDGGVLYDLEVERVVMTYDHASWRKLARKQRPVVAAIIRSLGAGDLSRAAKALQAHLAVLHAEFGPLASRFHHVAEMERYAEALAQVSEADASASSRAAACGQLVPTSAWRISANAAAMDRAVWNCAIRFYEKALAAKRDRQAARALAAELLPLYEMSYAFVSGSGERYERKAEALRRKLGEDLTRPDER